MNLNSEKNQKNNKTKRTIIVSIIIVLIVLALIGGTLALILPKFIKKDHTTQDSSIKRGMRITYQIKNENKNDLDSDVLKDTREKLQKRFDSYFNTEAIAYSDEGDKIIVEIPGVYEVDDELLEELGRPGILYFCTKTESDPTKEQLDAKEYVHVKGSENGMFDGYYKIWLSSNDVANAQGQAISDEEIGHTEYVVTLDFTSEGTRIFTDMTTQYMGQTSYIIYDGEVISSPHIIQAITGGSAQIDGQKNLKEAKALASYIEMGAIDVELEVLDYSVIGNKK